MLQIAVQCNRHLNVVRLGVPLQVLILGSTPTSSEPREGALDITAYRSPSERLSQTSLNLVFNVLVSLIELASCLSLKSGTLHLRFKLFENCLDFHNCNLVENTMDHLYWYYFFVKYCC